MRLVLKVVMQKDGEFVDVILLYWGLKHLCGCVFSNPTDGTVLHVVRKSVQCHSHFQWVLVGFLSYVTWPSNST